MRHNSSAYGANANTFPSIDMEQILILGRLYTPEMLQTCFQVESKADLFDLLKEVGILEADELPTAYQYERQFVVSFSLSANLFDSCKPDAWLVTEKGMSYIVAKLKTVIDGGE